MIWNMTESSRQVCVVVVVVQRVSERWASKLLWLFYLYIFFSSIDVCCRENVMCCVQQWNELRRIASRCKVISIFMFLISAINLWVWIHLIVKINVLRYFRHSVKVSAKFQILLLSHFRFILVFFHPHKKSDQFLRCTNRQQRIYVWEYLEISLCQCMSSEPNTTT